MNDEDLYMNTPQGYPFAQPLKKSDVGGIKSFLISTTPDEATQEMIRQMEDDQVIQTCLDNGFTFDAEWYGVRELEGSL